MAKRSFIRKRNKRKARRVVLQVIFLALLGIGIWFLVAEFPSVGSIDEPLAPQIIVRNVEPAEKTQRTKGFIALSYFGVTEEESETSISPQRLEEHLQALYDRGYVSISQQDVFEYYYGGGYLPEKALFLSFEDGLKRSMLLAQPILMKLGYQASMLSYANNLEENDGYFLTSEDLLAMEQTGYWELGVNGYRLSYINVFDRHDNFLGELTPIEYRPISLYLRRAYNHYLMDYIRDQYSVPMETNEQMAKRVENDYRMMENVYVQRIGRLPIMYSLMHSNTGQFATNDDASVENKKWISALFKLNFNREMLCLNDEFVDPLDLTRMQPQAYWSVNHLLMRIADDTDTLADMVFVTGDAERAAQWEIQSGVAQWDDNTIRLTTLSEGEGIIRFKGSETMNGFYASAHFDGNKMGKQSLDILADSMGSAYTAVELVENELRIYAGSAGADAGEPVFSLALDVLDGIVYPTMEENRQEAIAVEIDAKMRQTYKPDESKKIAETLERNLKNRKASEEELFIDEITLKDDGSRFVEVVVRDGLLYVSIDHKLVASAVALPTGHGGGLALRAGWQKYGYSQRNLADDVYDADFRDLHITSTDGATVYADYRAPVVVVEETVSDITVETLAGWQYVLRWLGLDSLLMAGEE